MAQKLRSGKTATFCSNMQDVTPGQIERDFVNRLASVVNSNVSDANDIDTFRLRYLLNQVSSKSIFTSSSNDATTRANLAIDKTLACNTHCELVNKSNIWSILERSGFLERARRIVHKILGEFDYGIYESSSFSSGASTSHKRGRSSPFYKYASLEYGGIDVTPKAESRFLALCENTPSMRRSFYRARFNGINPITSVICDRVTTVPKNSRIDRTILMQPAGNNCLQKAIGKAIRNKLLSVGVDLRDQSVNQELSRVGSQYRSHATIDLSSASDTLNARIVWELLPASWYRELEALRCTHGYISPTPGLKARMVKWHMFSAMGNAFTFELESLIFYAVSKAACDELGSYVGRINVFGDDIIVPNSCAANVCEKLSMVGFIVNPDKTFTEGDFRESCGAHWYRGVCVKPFYIRTGLTRYDEIIRLANQLRKWSSHKDMCDPRFYKIWKWLSDFIPQCLHGGFDLESSYSLVTPSRPRMKLVGLTNQYAISGEAALSAAMQTTVGSDICNVNGYRVQNGQDVVSDLIAVTDERFFLLRKNKPYGRYANPPQWHKYETCQ